MEAGDVAAVVVACVATFSLALLLWAVTSLVAAARRLTAAARQLEEATAPVVDALREAVADADRELDRVDTLLGAAEQVSATVDSASRLAYTAFSNPVIKAVAFASGTGRAARRLRDGTPPPARRRSSTTRLADARGAERRRGAS